MRSEEERLKAALVADLVALATGTERDALFGAHRGVAPTTRARQLAMYLTHIEFGYTLAAIGEMYGRDKSTVGHAVHQIEDFRDNSEFDVWLCELEEMLVHACRMMPESGRVLRGVWSGSVPLAERLNLSERGDCRV